jgi:hypothetical protein
MKLHRIIDHIKKQCSAQEPVLWTSYFLSYCPLLIFILYFMEWYDYLIDKKCSEQKLLLCTSYFFELLPFVNFDISFLSWPFLLNYIVHKATQPTHRVLVECNRFNLIGWNLQTSIFINIIYCFSSLHHLLLMAIQTQINHTWIWWSQIPVTLNNAWMKWALSISIFCNHILQLPALQLSLDIFQILPQNHTIVYQ